MKFEQNSDFAKSQAEAYREDQAEKVKSYLAKAVNQARMEGLPIRDNFRIEIRDFRDVFSEEEIRGDLLSIEREENKIAKVDKERGVKPEVGEHFEIFKTALFHKFLGNQFIVVRSSRYDDVFNHIDNVILDRESGNIVCAFDEVTDASGSVLEEKKQCVMKRNRTGVFLKYGLGIEEEEGGGRNLVRRGNIEHIPIFYLALSGQLLYQIMGSFNSSKSKAGISDLERRTLDYLIKLIESQIAGLLLEISGSGIEPDRRKLIENLKKFSKESLPKMKSVLSEMAS